MWDKTNRLVAIGLPCVLLIATLIYWPGLDGPFLLDDYVNIEVAYVDDFNIDDIYYAVTHNLSGTLGRPVSVFSLVISGILHGPEPWGYKFHNLVIHLVNGLLVFWLLSRLLPRLAPSQSNEKNLAIAGLVATAWLLHPLMVSTVLYAVQRMAQLTSLFILAALLVYVKAREHADNPGPRFYLLLYLGLPICFLLSFLSKENGVLIPLYILAIELIVFRFEFDTAIAKKRIMSFIGLFVLLPVTAGSIFLLTHLDRFTNYAARTFDMAERLMTQLHVVATYVKMILLPRLSDMTLFHDFVPVVRQFNVVTGLLLLVLVAAVALVFVLRKRAPVLAFAIAWFLISHLLESTFFSLELMFEHRNYLAALGPLLALFYYLCNVPSIPYLKYGCGVFLLLVVFLTAVRVQEWSNEEMIYEVAISEHPDSARAQSELATLKFNRGYQDEALAHLAIAQQNIPHDFGPVLQEVAFRCTTGANITPLVEESIRRAQQFPATPYGLNSLDNMLVLLNEGRCPEMDLEKLMSLVEAAESQPGNQERLLTLGFLEKIKGLIYLINGDYGRGIQFALSAYEKTNMLAILRNLVKNLIRLNLLGDAEQVILIMENINRESNGSETAIIRPLREQLESAQQQQKMTGPQPDTISIEDV